MILVVRRNKLIVLANLKTSELRFLNNDLSLKFFDKALYHRSIIHGIALNHSVFKLEDLGATFLKHSVEEFCLLLSVEILRNGFILWRLDEMH